MDYKQKLRGSAEIILVIILVLVIAGGIGYAVWHNSQKSTTTPASTSTTEPVESDEVVMKAVSTDEMFPAKSTLTYPENWTVDRKIEGQVPFNAEAGYTSETLTITSPSKDYSVVYRVGVNLGLGGNCDPAAEPTITAINHEEITGMSMGRFVKQTSRAQNGSYQFFAGIMDATMVSSVEKDDSVCDTTWAKIVPLHEQNNLKLLDGSVVIKGVNDDANTTTTQEAIDGAVKNSEYKQAEQILISTRLQ